MSKLLKFVGKLTAGLIEWVLILVIFLAFAIRTTPFQTFIAQKLTSYLSKELNTTFKIDRVSILFFHKVALDGVFVLDQSNDTLANIESVFITIKDFNQPKNLLSLDEVNMKGGLVKISRAKETGDYNYWFIQDFFDSGKKSSGGKPIDVTLDFLRLNRVTVHYDDYRKSYSSFGMDYDHLKFKNVYLFAGGFKISNGIINGFIKHISFREKGGFELSKFSTFVTIDPDGLKLKSLRIKTPYSKVHMAKLSLLMDEMEDLQYFEDSVTLDANILKSSVSLKDISYFGTALEGMDEKVILSAEVSKKVKNLKIRNLDLRFGKKSMIQGTINLPDFREFDHAFFQEKLTYAYISVHDLETIKMPKDLSQRYLKLGTEVNRLSFFEARNLKIDGFYNQFVVEVDRINTALGSAQVNHGLMFTENSENNSFTFEQSSASDYDVKLDSFQLDKFIGISDFGKVSGKFQLSGEIFSDWDIHVNKITGGFSRFDFMNYPYSNIEVMEASYLEDRFWGDIHINDPKLKLEYLGKIGVGKIQSYDFEVDISEAFLADLNLLDRDGAFLKTNFRISIRGKDLNQYAGSLNFNALNYFEADQKINLPSLDFDIQRNGLSDLITLRSSLLDLDFNGKIDFNTVVSDFNNQFAVIFPSILNPKLIKKSDLNAFSYSILVKNINPVLSIFVPDLTVSPNTMIEGNYHLKPGEFRMDLISNFIQYQNIKATNLKLNQSVIDSVITANYTLGSFSLQDSLSVQDVSFTTQGTSDRLVSDLNWNTNKDLLNINPYEAHFTWTTYVNSLESYYFELEPSYFGLNNHRWEIPKSAQIMVAPENIQLQNFLLSYQDQFIELEGCLSNDETERLTVQVHDFELNDLTSILGVQADVRGKLNGTGWVSDPFTDVKFNGEAKIDGLYVNNEEVGNVTAKGGWNKLLESVDLQGDLFYKNNKTFNFDGSYFVKRTTNQLDFNLRFDETEIQFANAFMDPKVVSGIRGSLDGNIRVGGNVDAPEIAGEVYLRGGNAKVEMFGVNFGLDGKIFADKDGIYINNMPIYDEEGNRGSLVGSVYHTNYADWNFDLNFNLDAYIDPETNLYRSNDRFLVLNTNYREDEIYYGRGYASGTANIFGYADNLDITVNMKTLSGSAINFPLYGNSDLEEDSFIIFESKDQDTIKTQPKIDFTGVNLDLNFEISQETQLKVIFNDLTNDEITTTGRGDMRIQLDNLGEVTMNGVYTVKKGMYNFALAGLKQPFYLQEGGTIAWTGDPYEAQLNMKTYVQVIANISDIMEVVESKSGPSNQQILCYLNLTGSLSEPLIAFDIQAPDATESGRAAINRIKNDTDELNRQFFSLLVQKKFVPLQGSSSSGGNAALDIVSNQLNGVLNQLSKDIRMNVALDNGGVSGESAYEFGVSKNFLDNKLLVKGSFGVENNVAAGSSQSTLIGDVNVEYLLNEQGTFRVSIFNESNNYTVIQEKDAGQFTQGVGIQYQEEFNNLRDFQLFQFVIDVFRKDKKISKKKNSRQKPVPAKTNGSGVLPDEK